eukprot:Rhum_TRINITY_DN516_c0_g1::Rhum_TRINITY_DN516_c0_g1_i1::g.1657::m.1657
MSLFVVPSPRFVKQTLWDFISQTLLGSESISRICKNTTSQEEATATTRIQKQTKQQANPFCTCFPSFPSTQRSHNPLHIQLKLALLANNTNTPPPPFRYPYPFFPQKTSCTPPLFNNPPFPPSTHTRCEVTDVIFVCVEHLVGVSPPTPSPHYLQDEQQLKVNKIFPLFLPTPPPAHLSSPSTIRRDKLVQRRRTHTHTHTLSLSKFRDLLHSISKKSTKTRSHQIWPHGPFSPFSSSPHTQSHPSPPSSRQPLFLFLYIFAFLLLSSPIQTYPPLHPHHPHPSLRVVTTLTRHASSRYLLGPAGEGLPLIPRYSDQSRNKKIRTQ